MSSEQEIAGYKAPITCQVAAVEAAGPQLKRVILKGAWGKAKWGRGAGTVSSGPYLNVQALAVSSTFIL